MNISVLRSLYEKCFEQSLFDRYIHTESIEPILEKLKNNFKVNSIGTSVNGLPIYSIVIGQGHKKILMWSQMHGNESTTTKAVFDMCNVFMDANSHTSHILEECEVTIIPILNPDGAKAYTRLNANHIDLNRDAQALSQPESKVLRHVFDTIQPDYCFNLHGQRTIYSAGLYNHSATVSFLAPAQNVECSVTETRKVAMALIVKMNEVLQHVLPNQVGIYDDTYNLNCVGDTFQSLHVPTILFEAGHYDDDYTRERTREYMFYSLLTSINCIAKDDIDAELFNNYLNIPKNEKLFYDIIIRNSKQKDIAIQFEERLVENKVEFIPKVEKISELTNFYGHKEIDANGYEVFDDKNAALKVGNEIVFVSINNEKFSLKA